jgi:L-ribulokinase
MTHPLEAAYVPNTSDQKIYDRLYAVYKDLHESFGVATGEKDLSQVMKELPSIADDGQG